MMKPAIIKHRELHIGSDVDQASHAMLRTLLKPLKLTATLKRRARKIKAAGRSSTIEAPL